MAKQRSPEASCLPVPAPSLHHAPPRWQGSSDRTASARAREEGLVPEGAHIELPRPPTVLSPVTVGLMEKHPQDKKASWGSQMLPPLQRDRAGHPRLAKRGQHSVSTVEDGKNSLPRLGRPSNTSVNQRQTMKGLFASAPDLRTDSSSSSMAEARQRESIRPASVTCRENTRKEDFVFKADAAEALAAEVTAPARSVQQAVSAHQAQAMSQRQLENFAAELERCDHLIRRLATGAPHTPFRDHNHHSHDVKSSSALNRQSTVEIANIKDRIANVLDTTSIEDTAAVQSAIPMQTIIVEGGKGREHIEVVHVALLRARCAQLMQGASVQSLLESLAEQQRKEWAQRLSPPSTAVSQSQWSPDVLLDLLFPAIAPMSSSAWMDMDHHDRRCMVNQRKFRQKYEHMLRTLRNMRGKLPEHAQLKFAAMSKAAGTNLPALAPFVSESQRSTRGGEIFWTVSKDDATRAASILEEIDAQRVSEELAGYSLDDALHAAAEAAEVMGKKNSTASGAVQPHTRRRVAMTYRDADQEVDIVTEEVLEARRQKALQAWRHARNVCWMASVGWRVLERHRSVDIIKAYLAGIGEWSRLKHCWRRLVDGVTNLQRKCREFRVRKTRRCDEIAREWQRVEDHHLSIYFKAYTEKVIMESVRKREEAVKKRGAIRRHAMGADSWALVRTALKDDSRTRSALVVDWHSFRIPEDFRKKVIGLFYTATLRRHIFSQAHLHSIVKQKLQHHMEVQRLVRQFGRLAGDEAPAAVIDTNFKQNMQDLKKEAIERRPQERFWHVSEDMCMNLIAHAARAMPEIDPSRKRLYEEHPSNSTVVASPLQRSEKQLRATQALLAGKFRLAILRSGQRRLPGGRLRWDTEAGRAKVKEGALDLDDVLNNFHPSASAGDDDDDDHDIL
mmetsp:Transcript_61553/g.146856  ORF Transcript_61553/g.146856 Transcript_61553/m.146856 type:complete len:902 (+) Transcript_61553:152-2857(+)